MSPNDAINALTEAMTLATVLSLPPILVASVVGIVVSLLQALTQVQEQTIAFAVTLIAVAVVMLPCKPGWQPAADLHPGHLQ